MRWTDKDMLQFAKVAAGGAYGDYKGCRTLESKLKRYKELKQQPKPTEDGKASSV